MESKRAALEQLALQIRATLGSTCWLFEEYRSVRGFLGDAPIMLVAERPSTAKFPAGPVVRFYELLERLGANDAHLTDVIKTRGRAHDQYPEDMSAHKRFFDLELEIVQPRRVIAFGQNVFDMLKFYLADRNVEVMRVMHYSHGGRWGPQKWAAFEQQLRDALANPRSTQDCGPIGP